MVDIDNIDIEDLVVIECPIVWEQGIPLVRDDAKSDKITASFKNPTLDDFEIIEKMAKGEALTDPDVFRKWVIRRCLIKWSIDIPIERNAGWILAKSFNKIMGVYGSIIDYLGTTFEKRSFYLTKEEENLMLRQSAQLFSPNSRGVSDACEGVSMFCNLGNMWEKFGFTEQTLGEMNFADYMRLKYVLSKEGEFSKSSSRATQSAPTMITGLGGKSRPSRARPVQGQM